MLKLVAINSRFRDAKNLLLVVHVDYYLADSESCFCITFTLRLHILPPTRPRSRIPRTAWHRRERSYGRPGIPNRSRASRFRGYSCQSSTHIVRVDTHSFPFEWSEKVCGLPLRIATHPHMRSGAAKSVIGRLARISNVRTSRTQRHPTCLPSFWSHSTSLRRYSYCRTVPPDWSMPLRSSLASCAPRLRGQYSMLARESQEGNEGAYR